MAHGGFQQRLRRGLTIFFLQILFQRSGVNANTDRDIFVARTINNHANTFFITDIAWVDTQTIDAVFRDFQRNAVVKVNIRDQRYTHLLLNQFEGFCRVHGRNGNTNYVSANALKRFNLRNRRVHVCGAGVCH